MSFLYNLNISARIYILVATLLGFIALIGGIGVYKMNIIGIEMQEIAERDIPLTRMLEKITIHQLEQAILMEKALRIQGVTAHTQNETFDSIVQHFKKLALKTDEEILEAEQMAATMIENTHNERSLKEFKKVLNELKDIEKKHKEYEHDVFDVFDNIKEKNQYTNSSDVSAAQYIAENKKIIKIETEQKELDKNIEALLEEISGFTEKSMVKSLADEQRGKILIATISIVVFICGIILATILAHSVTSPLKKLTNSMKDLSENNLDITIPSTIYKDEVNEMSKAMKHFQEKMLLAKALEEQQGEEEEKRQKRQDELNQLVGIFGSTIGAVFENIVSSSRDMVSRSTNMQDQSSSSQKMATDVASESRESSSNAQALSAATEQMVASIREISEQVNRSSEVTKKAVETSEISGRKVKDLQKTSKEIEEVIGLINDIAEQTNLLALNATIEAARAGEAGKGFAVVANEVKALASQTSNATDEIARKISSIQTASTESAESIEQIGDVISNIDQYVTAIMSAIEEQNSTTEEISRSVQHVSDSALRVTENVAQIQSQSTNIGESSKNVNEQANNMSEQADILSLEVKTFLDAIKNTDAQDTTYEAHKISQKATAKIRNDDWSGTAMEISAAHAVVSPQMTYAPGENISISLEGIDEPIQARISNNDNNATIIQFPLDASHLNMMKEKIKGIA